MTQKTLAEKAKLSRSSIGKIESGNTVDVSLSTVVAIAEVFELPPYLLLLSRDDWSKLATVSSLRDMVQEGMLRMVNMEDISKNEIVTNVDRLEQLSLSEKQSDKAEAAKEIGAIASLILGQETDKMNATALSTFIPAALGASMLPSLPILNGIIAGVLSRKKKHF